MRNSILALSAILAVAGVITAGLMGADAHPGHTQKILFDGRWYNAATMDLSTSKIDSTDLFQFCSTPGCMAAWTGTIQASINDWNAQQDTADFVLQGDYNLSYDINTWAFDNANMTAFFGPGILGIALPYDADGNFCDPNNCSPPSCVPGVTCNKFYYGDAIVNHDLHAGVYGTAQSKQATMTHELGHLLSLCHESVVGDCHSAESAILECGSDDSGSIPVSIMSYDCINPPAVGGSGIYLVRPFDVCGVNHAYPDAAFGFAGCPATPTPIPTPSPTPIATGPNAWGNVDCGGGIGAVDALKVLRHAAGLTVSQTEPCPNIATELHVSGWTQGDVDCSTAVSAVDALKLLRFSAGLSVAQAPLCPLIGTEF